MTRTRNFIDGVVLNYGHQALVMTVGLWLTPFLIGRLGQHDFGLWLVGLQSLTYLSLLDLGVIGLLPREVAKASGCLQSGADSSGLRTLIEDNIVVALWQTPILICALIIAYHLLRNSAAGNVGPLSIILATFGIQFPLRVYFASLEGLQDFAFIGYLQLAGWLGGVAVNVAMVVSGMGLYGLAAGWTVTQATVTLGSIWRVYARHRQISPVRLRWLPFPEIGEYLKSGFWMSISQVTQMLVKGTDLVMIATLQGPAAAVPFSCSSRLQTVLANQPQVILQSAQPGLTQLRSVADREHLARVIGALAQAMLMLSGAVGCLILALNEGFVRRWVGPHQYLGFWFTALSALGMLVRHLNSTTVYTLFCFGKERFISLIGLADSVCFALLLYVFVRRFGPIGVPLSSIVSVCIVSLPWNFRMLASLTGLSCKEQLRPILAWAIPFFAVAVIVGLASRYFVPDGYPACAATGVVVLLVYCAVEFPVIRKSLWWSRVKALGMGWKTRLKFRTESGIPPLSATSPENSDLY